MPRHSLEIGCTVSQILLAICLCFTAVVGAAVVQAQNGDAELLARLSDEQRRNYAEWRQARSAFDGVHERYWADVNARRAERRRKRGTGEAFTIADFIIPHPPKYVGPALRPDIAKLMAELKPPVPETPIPIVADVLAQAKQNYNFVPRLTSEREFKRSYAAEALAVGLTKDQVVRVYALETGGRGTFDMQAGFDPETKRGSAISTALGYAQLLAANSIDELIRHGEGFVSRLGLMATAEGVTRERAAELAAKINSIRAMLKVAKSVPREWSEHVKLSVTPAGIGIHALNIDADIGPWLQVLKLKGLKDLADKSGRPNMTGAEIELMNLAGPRTGLEMMEPVAHGTSTANFFSQAGYYRNGIVREKSAAELLVALDKRMNDNVLKAGSVEFAAVFDEIISGGFSPVRAVAEPMPRAGIAPPMPIRAPAPPPTARPSMPVVEAAPSPLPRMEWAPRQLTEQRLWSPLSND